MDIKIKILKQIQRATVSPGGAKRRRLNMNIGMIVFLSY